MIKQWTDNEGRTFRESYMLCRVGRAGHKTHRALVLTQLFNLNTPREYERVIHAYSCCQAENRRGRFNLTVQVFRGQDHLKATCEWCRPKTQEPAPCSV